MVEPPNRNTGAQRLLSISDDLDEYRPDTQSDAGERAEIRPCECTSLANNFFKILLCRPENFLTRRPATFNGNRIRARMMIPWHSMAISVMPYIMTDQQGGDTGGQRANNIAVDAAKIDGIVQFLADLFKPLPFACQSLLRLIPIQNRRRSGQNFHQIAQRVIGIHQPVADKQRIAFHGFACWRTMAFNSPCLMSTLPRNRLVSATVVSVFSQM